LKSEPSGAFAKDPVQEDNQQGRPPVSKKPGHLFLAHAPDRKTAKDLPRAFDGQGIWKYGRNLCQVREEGVRVQFRKEFILFSKGIAIGPEKEKRIDD
jgi:hypothetical protein